MKNITKIPVFLASDDNYSPFVATTMVSILEHTSSSIDFYILDGGISRENEQRLKTIQSQYDNVSIEFIRMSNLDLNRFPNIKHYSLNTFSRYFIASLKPNIDKALYLDVDVIVKNDILELFSQSLDNKPIGGVLEDFYTYNYSYLTRNFPEYRGGSNYFNAGVLILNLKYFRENNLVDIFVNKTIELKDKLNCPDQDIFNLVFQNNFKILDYKFNLMPDHADVMYSMNNKQAIDALNSPFIIHYTGLKPWKTLQGERAYDFWEIANLTAFYEILKDKFKILDTKKILKSYFLLCKYLILSKMFVKNDKYKTKIRMNLNEINCFKKIKKCLDNIE